MSRAAVLGACPLPRLGAARLDGRHGHHRTRAVVVAARHGGSGRRWWSDAWEDDSGGGSGSLDAASAAVEEELITFFCCDGSVVRLGAHRSPPEWRAVRRGSSSGGGGSTGSGFSDPLPLPLPEEQGLCIGSVFAISATNGLEPSRRLNLLGFCFSTEQLFEQVEATVLRRGGEVFETQRQLKSGVHECLQMTVAIPYLWGVPPEYERLKAGIETGGGIIDRECREWVIY